MDKYGIDVSHENGPINWNQVKKSGKVDFAILRIHQRFGADKQFARNYKKCTAKGIPVGAYKYSYAMTVEDAKLEAKEVLKLAEGKNFQYPIFYDLEWDTLRRLGSRRAEEIALAFLKKVKKAGFKVGIYCNVDWYRNVLTDKLKTDYDLWLASYPGTDLGKVEERLRPPVGVGWQYSERGTVPGIEGTVDMNVFYKDYTDGSQKALEPAAEEKKEASPQGGREDAEGVSAANIINIARTWLGRREADGSHREIIDLYNSHKPLARGYAVQYTDSWCDTFVSACFIKAGAVGLIGGTECGVDAHIQLFKTAGIWEEDGTIAPNPGDIICYNWDSSAQPNDGFADHIGIVESVSGKNMTIIEGNCNDAVERRTIPVGWGYIRGFARPKYGAKAEPVGKTGQFTPAPQPAKSLDQIALEVISGDWGNGPERIERLRASGYDPEAVQKRVNDIYLG